MEDFTYSWKTEMHFGSGKEKLAGELCKGHRVLLHYGTGSIKKSGLYDRIVQSLNDSNVDFVELGGAVPNPRIEKVREGIELCRKENIDFILAVGGGSVIDSAKGIAAGFYYDGDPWDFYSKKIPVEKAIPIGTILTIPAAGSEASAATVITNGNRKLSSYGECLRPKFSILNPELTLTLPQFQTACGISDMMAHIFERYFSNTKGVDLTDRLCEGTLRSIIKNARILNRDPNNLEARKNIMWAGSVAHQGFLGNGRQEDWASHKIEHELSAFYDITHGAGLSIVFPAWMKYVKSHDEERFRQFAKEVFGKETPDEAIAELELFYKEIGLPTRLSDININDEKFDEMSELAVPGEYIGNFVKLKKEDVKKIYELARNGS